MDVVEEMNEFTELMESVNPDIINLEDRVLILQAYVDFRKKVEPIYLKYAMKDPNVSSFLYKL